MKVLNKKGFTLLEVISVMGILTIVLVGVSSLVIQNLQAQNLNRNFLLASMLAQEGLEIVRNKRDTNWLEMQSDENWDWQFGQSIGAPSDIIQDQSYTIDHRYYVINSTPDDLDHIGTILYRDIYGYYDHDPAGTASIFRRLIIVDDYSSGTTTISAHVRWNHRGSNHSYVASSELYNWR